MATFLKKLDMEFSFKGSIFLKKIDILLSKEGLIN